MATISPLSVVDPKAELAEDVEVGPFCLIGPHVRIGAGCKLVSHVVVQGHTTLGKGNVLHPTAAVGGPPQDRRYRGSATRLEIGDGNIIREGVTIHTGTDKGGGITRVGSHNYLMGYTHIGHDIQFGNHSLMANGAMLGGHVICGDYVNIMAGAGVNQWVTIGEHTFIGAFAQIHMDVPPFCRVDGEDRVRAINSIGLMRAGIERSHVNALDQAYRQIFRRRGQTSAALAQFDTMNGVNEYVKRLVEFLRLRGASRNGRAQEGRVPTA